MNFFKKVILEDIFLPEMTNLKCKSTNRLLVKLGNDGFSLILFGIKVAESKEFFKRSNIVPDKKMKKVDIL
jgi:hypothetical protein